MTAHMGLPVAGYRPQSSDAIDRVNANKADEERTLRMLDAMATRDDVDKRWLAIGRTHLEQALDGDQPGDLPPGACRSSGRRLRGMTSG